MRVLKAPDPKMYYDVEGPSVFFAGSIEMGKAVDWQSELTKMLEKTNITIFNPRRDDWDSSWKQDINDPQFKEQVMWELNAQEKATVVALYLAPGTQSPISLLEFGIFGGKMVVYCPEGFWRKGNVDIVCAKYGYIQVKSFEEMVTAIKNLTGAKDV